MKILPIVERAIAHGERTAVRSATGTATYCDLVSASETIATTLLRGSDDLNEARIAYLVPAGKRHIQTQWGVWRAGGIAVPLSLSATKKELEYALTDSQATTVVVTNELAERIRSLCEQLNVRLLSVDDPPSTPNAQLPEVASERRAMILYTSGTTSTLR